MPVLRILAVIVGLTTLTLSAEAADSLGDVPKKAIERSAITTPGSRPFVLRAKVLEITNLQNADYQAEIEETWVAPDKFRRTVKTRAFSETLIVNGDKTSEQITGEYYPNWLRTIVTAIFDPGKALQGVDLSRSSDNPVIGGTKVCRRFTYMAGVAPISNKVFSSYCFDNGLIDMVVMPGYEAIYRDYKKFGGKEVARTVNQRIEDGTDLRATIDEVSELKSLDESMFVVPESSKPLQTLKVSEQVLRGMAMSAPEISWPAQYGGAQSGTLSLYVCLDRHGHIQEVLELNSSNPGLSDVARDQVKKWQFKAATSDGMPVQVESILTFSFPSNKS